MPCAPISLAISVRNIAKGTLVGGPNSNPDNWNRDSHEMKKDNFGVFEIVLPAVNASPAIAHDSKVKVRK